MKRVLIVAMLTFMASAAVLHVQSLEPLENEALLGMPMEINDWRGRTLPLEDWVLTSLQTPYAIMREYRSPEGKRLNLAIVWYDDKEIAFHSPEACLGGVGNTVRKKHTYGIQIRGRGEDEIGELVVEQNSRSQLALYYFISDGYVTPSQMELRAEILKKRFQFKRTSAALVRIMADVQGDPKQTRQMLKDFLKDSFPLIKVYTGTKSITKP